MAYSSDTIVFGIEKKYGVQAIESKEKGLWYLQDEERKQLGLLTVSHGIPSWIILKKEQFKTLIKEMQDVYDMVFN